MVDKIFGSKKQEAQQVTVQMPGPSPVEVELQQQQLEVGRKQLAAFERAEKQQAEAFDFLKVELDRLSAPLPPDPVVEKIKTLELERLERGGRATAEEKKLIAEATGAAETEGTAQIERFRSETLADIRDVMAPARGLRPGDSPITEAAGRVGAEATRQKGALSAGMAKTRAEGELNFPLARDTLLSQIGQFQQNLAQESQSFALQLREAAFNARMNMAALQTQGGLGLLGVSPAGSSGLATLTALRSASAGRTATGSSRGFDGSSAMTGVGNLALGIGGVMRGFAAVRGTGGGVSGGRSIFPSLSTPTGTI